MRQAAPHPVAKYRYLFFSAAVVAWAAGFGVLSWDKGNPDVPVAAVAGISALVFVWTNGIYWWLELCYPHLKVADGAYVSRTERRSEAVQLFVYTFFAFYVVAAVFASYLCLEIAAHG